MLPSEGPQVTTKLYGLAPIKKNVDVALKLSSSIFTKLYYLVHRLEMLNYNLSS